MTSKIRNAFKFLVRRGREMRGDAGGAIVEMALMIGIFGTPMMLATVESATWVYSSIEVSNAAHAGAMYGMTSATLAADTSGIAAARAEATDFGTNLTVTPTVYFACSAAIGGTQYSTQSAAVTASALVRATMPLNSPGLHQRLGHAPDSCPGFAADPHPERNLGDGS